MSTNTATGAAQSSERVETVGNTGVIIRRVVAVVIDTVILTLGLAAFGTLFLPFEYWIIILMVAIGQFLYFFVLEGLTGRTVGKLLTRIEVVKTDGSPIDFRDSLVRNLVRYIDSALSYAIGVVFVLQSEDNQRLGDRYANTLVVKR